MNDAEMGVIKLNALIVPLIDAKGTPLGLVGAREIAAAIVQELTSIVRIAA